VEGVQELATDRESGPSLSFGWGVVSFVPQGRAVSSSTFQGLS